MSTRINWTNPNTAFDEIRIYRTDLPFDDATIPTVPIVTLTEGTTWLDTSTVQNMYYYYTVAIVVNGEVILAPAKRTIHMPYTGPGPQSIQCGDITRGYFGTVPSAEMHTNAEICALVGVGGVGTSATWVKFIRNGKVLFMNLYPVSTSTTWNNLYNGGLVYGMDNIGPATGHGLTGVNQRRVITKGEHSFVVRMLRMNDNADWLGSAVEHGKGENGPLLLAAMSGVAIPGAEALADYSRNTYFTAGLTPLAEITGINCMYIDASGNTSVNMLRTAGGNWRPVLELVL